MRGELNARTKESNYNDEETTELRRKLQCRDDDLELLYRKNLQLKQTIVEFEKTQTFQREQISALKSSKKTLESEKSSLEATLGTIDEKYQKELNEIMAAYTRSTAALELMTQFDSPLTDSTDGK